MSAVDECGVSDTETFVYSNDGSAESNLSQDTDLDVDLDTDISTDIDSTSDSTMCDRACKDFQASLNVECGQESIKSVKDSVLTSQNFSHNAFLREHPLNNTEKALTSFGRVIFAEWPKQNNNEALEVLTLQLVHGGGFCANMELIDLSTPENVRFDTQDVLSLLQEKMKQSAEKMKQSAINRVEKFVLPNVKQLTTGDMVESLLGDFCGAFCGKNVTITEVVLRCDEVSSEFIAGDLEWIDSFLSCYNLEKVTIYTTRKSVCRNKEYEKLRRRLCGKKKAVDHDKTFFLKRCATNNNSSTSKRARNETTVGEDKDTSDVNDMKVLNNKACYTTLLDLWKTGELHDKGIDGRGVTIAFLDSGINIAHKAFKERIIAVNDITCSGNIDLTTDRNGHGTLCASIACGAAFKSTGSKGQNVRVPAGVAPGANIIMYKITGSAGQAHAGMITKGLKQCLEDKGRYGIDIVLLPFGSDNYDYEQGKVISVLRSQGVLVVTASGNNGELKDISCPARFGHTICVGAHDKYGNTTPYTTKGRALDFTAPGENLTGASSIHPSMMTTGGGTSFAAACVAGLLALIIQRARDIASDPRLSGIEPSVNKLVHDQDVVKKVLRNISKNSSEQKKSCGHGCLKPTAMLFHNQRLSELLYQDVLTTPTDTKK